MHLTFRPFLIAIAVAMLVLAAGNRIYRLMPVLFSRSFSYYPVEGANPRRKLEAMMTHALHLPYQRDSRGLLAQIRAVARAWAAEHALALTAATRAARSRTDLAELRALYVGPHDSSQKSSM